MKPSCRFSGTVLVVMAFLVFSSCRSCQREETEPVVSAAAPVEPVNPSPPPAEPAAEAAPVFDQAAPTPPTQAVPMTPGAVIPLWNSKGPGEEAWSENKKDQQVRTAIRNLYQYQQLSRKESAFTTQPASGPREDQMRLNIMKGKGAPAPEGAVPAGK